MPTANRRRWMRDYMKEYRQGKLRKEVTGRQPQPKENPLPSRREKLKEAHRLDSFKWRLSRLLGPQYEILLYVQYGPAYDVFNKADNLILGYDQEFYNNNEEIIACFPILENEFKYICDRGGRELFKVFLFRKYSRNFDRATDCIVGVLDKAALLENLQKLPRQGGSKWEKVLNKVRTEARQGTWRKLDFSREPELWLESYNTECYSLKWTTKDLPSWNSSELHSCLYEWALGSRRIGRAEKYEWPKARDNDPRRSMLSPMLWCDEIWSDEIA
jgi:hypothetical protein